MSFYLWVLLKPYYNTIVVFSQGVITELLGYGKKILCLANIR